MVLSMIGIGIGIRKNLLYPFLLIVFIALRRVIEILIKEGYGNLGKFLLPFLIFFAKFLAGLITFYFFIREKKFTKAGKITGLKLVRPKRKRIQVDSHKKIFVLIFVASYLDFVGTLVRKFYVVENKSLENKLRSFQIIVSAILCYFTIKIKMYRHNVFSLILISLSSIIIIIIEIIDEQGIKAQLMMDLGLTFFSGFGRAFLDTIEKHLFEFDYMSPFKILMFEGFINCCLTLVLFIFSGLPKGELFSLYNREDKEENWPFLLLIFFLLLYFILSGFKNIYRVITIKIYSPMTRALAETVVDPLIILYDLFEGNDAKNIKWTYYLIINFFCLIIIVFCSLVYNDFIILYCFGLEENTYSEIRKRSIIREMNNLSDSSLDESNEEDEDIFY